MQVWERSRFVMVSDNYFAAEAVYHCRIGANVLLQKMAAGETEAELLKAYPQLSKADLRAAWEYEGRVARTGGLRRPAS